MARSCGALRGIQVRGGGDAKVVLDHHRHLMTAGIAARAAPEVSEFLSDDVGFQELERPGPTVGGRGKAVSKADDEVSTVRVAS